VVVLVPTRFWQSSTGARSGAFGRLSVRNEVLSRFRSPKETRAVVARIARGEVDIVIGTHRLLSQDVAFKDLGLLVVDEEHRFGVRHKERLKAFEAGRGRADAHGNPDPRTLHLSLAACAT